VRPEPEFRCTYRLQLQPGFGFREARALVPYLQQLGVSHLYLSPSLRARSGSTHGYDVVDPRHVSEELGGEAAFRELASAGLGVVLDVVPNHMATSDENPFWRDGALRAKFFDWDPATGWHRRFFTIDELAGVRVEDDDVFRETHAKVLELVSDGLVQGLRIDHPDGLADPRGYLERLRDRHVRHVWVEKILEPGEQLRDWPVEGTTGYEFANDVTALFVDARAEASLTRWYTELTGETRSFEQIAREAKLEQVRADFQREFDKLSALLGDVDVQRHQLEQSAAALPIYRTYVEPWSGRVDDADRVALALIHRELRQILLLEQRGFDEFVVRFQQTTGAVMAKGVEDTSFYRYLRLTALNEVGGDPGRFGVPVPEFHDANARREERFPNHLLATQTHDTKRSGDVRARIVALTWVVDEWLEWRSDHRALADPVEDELLWQSLIGAWPISRERLDAYMLKAIRESKRNTNWVTPDESHERSVSDGIARLYQSTLVDEVERFVERIAAEAATISLGMTLLKLTGPGVPDIYQGDELESLNLVDPDNRRPVDWEARKRALDEPPAKLEVVLAALGLRKRRPLGEYRPLDAGADVCAFLRGDDVAVVVPVRRGARPDVDLPGRGWHALLDPSLPVALFERGG
jgi:(1->4)-alpha-D-glucan 1-alpha-D-glucosylmutase